MCDNLRPALNGGVRLPDGHVARGSSHAARPAQRASGLRLGVALAAAVSLGLALLVGVVLLLTRTTTPPAELAAEPPRSSPAATAPSPDREWLRGVWAATTPTDSFHWTFFSHGSFSHVRTDRTDRGGVFAVEGAWSLVRGSLRLTAAESNLPDAPAGVTRAFDVLDREADSFLLRDPIDGSVLSVTRLRRNPRRSRGRR